MRERGRGGDGGRDWGSIDWSNIDLSGFGRGTRVPGPSRRAVLIALALPNLYFALRPQVPRVVVDTERRRRGAVGSTLRYMWLLLIPAFFFGIAGGDEWDPLLRWLNQVPFGQTDPVFGRDIGFYFFTLPILEFVR